MLGLLDFDGQLRRRLFKDFHILGKDPKELKTSYTTIITARHFNSLLSSVKATIASLEQLRAEHLSATKEAKIKSAERWLKAKAAKLDKLSSLIKAMTTYRDAKRKALREKKRSACRLTYGL